MIFLETEDLLYVAHRVMGIVQVRDLGLLEAAAARPRLVMAVAEGRLQEVPEIAARLVTRTT